MLSPEAPIAISFWLAQNNLRNNSHSRERPDQVRTLGHCASRCEAVCRWILGYGGCVQSRDRGTTRAGPHRRLARAIGDRERLHSREGLAAPTAYGRPSVSSPDRCGSCPSSDFGAGRDPKGVRLVALAMQLEHAVDQVLYCAALLREGGEVTQVPLAGREVFW